MLLYALQLLLADARCLKRFRKAQPVNALGGASVAANVAPVKEKEEEKSGGNSRWSPTSSNYCEDKSSDRHVSLQVRPRQETRLRSISELPGKSRPVYSFGPHAMEDTTAVPATAAPASAAAASGSGATAAATTVASRTGNWRHAPLSSKSDPQFPLSPSPLVPWGKGAGRGRRNGGRGTRSVSLSSFLMDTSLAAQASSDPSSQFAGLSLSPAEAADVKQLSTVGAHRGWCSCCGLGLCCFSLGYVMLNPTLHVSLVFCLRTACYSCTLVHSQLRW